MESTSSISDDEPRVDLSVMVVADVQDALLSVMHDLHRLETLLHHASDNLLGRFQSVCAHMALAETPPPESLNEVRQALRASITDLQFQDMASQLIIHTTKVLQGCAFRLAAAAMPPEEGEEDAPGAEEMPGRPNPVTQSEMDAGSVELF